MQTFLPYTNFEESLMVLDMRRLGKQRIEARQIMLVLQGESQGWANHPTIRMWRGYLPALCLYYNAALAVFARRGGKNKLLQPEPLASLHLPRHMPWWLGVAEFHLRHRSNLLTKDQEYYRKHFPNTPFGLPYLWPMEEVGWFTEGSGKTARVIYNSNLAE